MANQSVMTVGVPLDLIEGSVLAKPNNISAFSVIFASELRAVVFGVDYRLAPEYPFPAALDGCCEALEWVGTLFVVRVKRKQTLTAFV